MTLDTMQAVVAELARRGIRARLDYPGSIQISDQLTVTLIFGDANATFDCDVVDFNDNVLETIESAIPADCADVQLIANHIACTYTEAAGFIQCGITEGK